MIIFGFSQLPFARTMSSLSEIAGSAPTGPAIKRIAAKIFMKSLMFVFPVELIAQDRLRTHGLGRAEELSEKVFLLLIFHRVQGAPAPAKITPSFPGETANHHQTKASSAAKSQNNQFWPGIFEAVARKPAGRAKAFLTSRFAQAFSTTKQSKKSFPKRRGRSFLESHL